MNSKKIISIIVFILAAIGGKLAYDEFFKESEIVSFELSDWSIRSYLGAQFESPFELSTMEVPLPPSVKQYVKVMENYKYESNPISLVISRAEYVEGISVDLDGAVKGSNQNMSASKEISDYSYESKPINKNLLEGRLVNGTCKVKGKEAEFIAEYYKSDLKLMWVCCLYLKHDENRDIKDRIMNSLKITL